MHVTLAVPDLVSPSYFPAIAAVDLGLFADRGIDADLQLRFPVTQASHQLRSGEIDLLAGAAHAALYAFPRWDGVRLAAALSQHTYWFLVVSTERADPDASLTDLRDLRIAAAPGPELGLVRLFAEAGVDLDAAGIEIIPVPRSEAESFSFGVIAAEALADKKIDGFWANGMGAEVAVRSGMGQVVLDARRTPSPATDFTFSALMVTTTLLREQPEVARVAVDAIATAQRLLTDDPTRATEVGRRLFPAMEAELIAELVRRDTPFYTSTISEHSATELNRFAAAAGLDPGAAGYDDVVAVDLASSWLT